MSNQTPFCRVVGTFFSFPSQFRGGSRCGQLHYHLSYGERRGQTGGLDAHEIDKAWETMIRFPMDDEIHFFFLMWTLGGGKEWRGGVGRGVRCDISCKLLQVQ